MIHISESDFDKYSDRKRVNFINSLSGMKSCNLIGSIDLDCRENLSIISSAFHLGANPALLGFIIRPDSVPRHTLENMRETKICTLNHVHSEIYEKAHQTSARYDKSRSEFKEVGLTPQYLDDFRAPFVQESRIKLSLELIREVPIIENGTHLMICKITNVYLPENAMDTEGNVLIDTSDSICVSGLNRYHSTKLLSQLKYAKAKS